MDANRVGRANLVEAFLINRIGRLTEGQIGKNQFALVAEIQFTLPPAIEKNRAFVVEDCGIESVLFSADDRRQHAGGNSPQQPAGEAQALGINQSANGVFEFRRETRLNIEMLQLQRPAAATAASQASITKSPPVRMESARPNAYSKS